MSKLAGKYAIAGVGESDVGRQTGRAAMDLQLEAATRAIADAGLDKSEIDAVISRSPHSAPQDNYCAVIAAQLGLQPNYLTDVGLSGASSVAMILAAVGALEAGFCTTVLCVNGDASARRGPRRDMHAEHTNWIDDLERPFGMLGAPIQYALPAMRHMYEYGTTSEQFGAIAVACRKHALLTPNAVMKKPMTLADHQASRMVVDPFHLLDCTGSTDGAGAVIVTSAERARDLRQPPVYILGLGQKNTHSDVQYAASMTTVAMRGASRQAYAMAGLGPKDIDVAELYDCFTSVVLVTLEDYGFCEKGEGGPFVENGRIELGGELPVNTSGGLLSQVNASGFFHITEAATQMRGTAGARQVAGAETAIVSGQCAVTGVNACLILGNHAS
ncbi:MAG: thiolase family protein [Candidatus Lustribacter sp.]